MKRQHAEVVNQSPTMRSIVSAIEALAETDQPALLIGEDGTGKSRLARLLASKGRRQGAAFIEVSYDPAPTETARDEIFEAQAEHPGAIFGADSGTMLIDELRSLTLPAQDELLSYLATGEVRGRRVDVRIVLMSHVSREDSLKEYVERGLLRAQFLEKTFATIEVPPLRERRDEIPALCQAILVEEAEVWTLPEALGIPNISPEALLALQRYDWPRNTSELKRELLRAVGRSGGADIRKEHLAEKIAALA